MGLWSAFASCTKHEGSHNKSVLPDESWGYFFQLKNKSGVINYCVQV